MFQPFQPGIQRLKLLLHRVGHVDLVHLPGEVHLLPGDAHHPGGDAHGGGLRRYFAEHHRVGRDAGIVPYFEGAQHFGSGGHHHIVPQGGVALAVVLAGAPQGDPVVEQAVVADLGRLADDDAHAVVDEQALADLRAGVYLDAGHMPRKLRKRTREEKVLVLIEPVCLAVVKQSMEALIEEDDLERGARRRVAVADRASVVEQALENHNTDIHSLEIERTSRFAENTM